MDPHASGLIPQRDGTEGQIAVAVSANRTLQHLLGTKRQV
jgi:hypothetical protein